LKMSVCRNTLTFFLLCMTKFSMPGLGIKGDNRASAIQKNQLTD